MHALPDGRTACSRAAALAVAVAALGAVTLPAVPAYAADPAAPAAAAPFAQFAPLSQAAVTQDASGAFHLTWQQAPFVQGVDVYASTDPDHIRAHGTLAASTTGAAASGSAAVTGLDGTRRWYFLLVPRGPLAGFTTATAVRGIPVAGTRNTRDIGGYSTADGLQVRWGSVFRSDTLSGVTPAGVSTLAGLGLDRVVDFRSDSEIAANGPDHVPTGVDVLNEPIGIGGGGGGPADIFAMTPAQYEQQFGNGQAVAIMKQAYASYVTDPEVRSRFADALRAIADGRDPALFHCSAGKDRTGWMAAVLLTALGVPRDTVYADYLISRDNMAPVVAAVGHLLSSAGYNPDYITPMLTVDASYLDTAFDQVQATYGSFAAYLHDGLGLDPGTLARLRARLLTPQR
ncbi:tyrosine-protein phosphatase [Yinghuangia seranimata]|uniref:tyrosine-protein phosphatase n=1 Tax=Yinghuangia seranimata TaxID=408067 RepID=UPI00248B0C69|nr:tyrosine-protein phosphatase [Yinghuangia seranimata]MDI2127054.1 tyrosine-protein phosphatase [Yinghuangia seranimata]